jgi:hypothetical protein
VGPCRGVKREDSRLSERFAVAVDSVLGALHGVDMGSVADVSEVPCASITHLYPEDAGSMDPSKVSIARMHGGPAACFLSDACRPRLNPRAFHWLFVVQFCF